MDPKWVFEKDAYEDGNTELMIEYCKSKRIPHQLVDFVMFGSDSHIKWAFGPEECVVVYGTIGLCRHVQRRHAWYPGVWCDWDQLKCTTYLTHWGKYSVQEDYAFYPAAEIHRLWDKMFTRFASDGHVFLKPDDNDKRFHGEKVSVEFADQWYATVPFYGAPQSSLTLISRPTRIRVEWRFVMANRKIVSGSLYRADGRTGLSRVDPDWDFDKSAMEFAEKVANSTEWQPAPMYSLDVCLVEGGEFKLMEVGSVNCCGLYKCDVGKIIDAANELAIVEWNEAHSKDS